LFLSLEQALGGRMLNKVSVYFDFSVARFTQLQRPHFMPSIILVLKETLLFDHILFPGGASSAPNHII
jgi:predicted TIM-barrel fold metal-dependent hydrolase